MPQALCPKLLPVLGVPVEEPVGGGITALSEVTDVSGDGREHEEEVERVRGGQFVQVQRPVRLRRQYLVETGPVHVHDAGAADDACTVEDAVQLAESFLGGGERRVHAGPVGHVASEVEDLRPGGLQGGDLLPQCCVRLPAAEQDEPCPALRGKVRAEVQPQGPGTPADQVDATLLQRQLSGAAARTRGPRPQYPLRAGTVGVPDLVPALRGGALGPAQFPQHAVGGGVGVPRVGDLQAFHPEQVIDHRHGPAEAQHCLARRTLRPWLRRQHRQVLDLLFGACPVHGPEQVQQTLQLDREVGGVPGQRPEVDDGPRQQTPFVQRPQEPFEVLGAAAVHGEPVRARLLEGAAAPYPHDGARVRRRQPARARVLVVEEEQGAPRAHGLRVMGGGDVRPGPPRHVVVQLLALVGRELLEHQTGEAHALGAAVVADHEVDAHRAVPGDPVDGGVAVGPARNRREHRQLFEAERDAQHSVLLTDAPEGVERRVEQRGVQGEAGVLLLQAVVQHDPGQRLGLAAVQRLHGLEGLAVSEAQVPQARVDLGVLASAGAPRLDRVKVDRASRPCGRVGGVAGPALGEDGAFSRGPVVDDELQHVRFERGQLDVHGTEGTVQDDRTAPDDAAQDDVVGAGGQPGGRVRHLHVGDAGQQDLPAHDVVAKEELVRRELLAEALRVEGGVVGVQQWVHGGGRGQGVRCRAVGPRGVGPVGFACEGVARQ